MPQQAKPGSFEEDEIVTPASTGAKPVDPGFAEDPVVRDTQGTQGMTDEQKANMAKTEAYLNANDPSRIPQMTEFGQTLWEEGVKGVPVGVWNMFRHPWNTAKEMGKAELSEFEKAYQSAKEGNYWGAAGYTAAGLAPVAGAFFGPAGVLTGFGLGQAASTIGEEIPEGHYGKAVAHGVMAAAPEIFSRWKAGPLVKGGRVGPEMERALQAEERAGVEMTTGQKVRSKKWQKRERMLTNVEAGGVGEKAEEAFIKQEEALRQRADTLAGKVAPTTFDMEDAGNTVKSELNNRGARFKNVSQRLYARVEAQTAQAKQRLQNGPRYQWQNPATGQMQWVTPMKTFEAPVDIRTIKAQMRPIWDEFQHAWGQQPKLQASPGYQALQNLMATKDWYMNAMDLDKTLSSIKSLVRDGNSKILTTPSNRIAKASVHAGEQALDRAFTAIDPKLKTTLQRARDNWKSYVDAAHLNDWLGENGGEAFDKLTRRGFVSLDEIRDIKKLAPNEIPNIARAHMDQIISKGTQMGGFDRTAGMLADWENGLELKVRQELYGTAMEAEIHDFFRAAKYLNPAEGAQTAGRLVAMQKWAAGPGRGVIGATGAVAIEMLTAYATGHQGLGAMLSPAFAAGGALWRGQIQPRMWARLLFTPGGARVATQVLQLPVGSKPWIRALQILGARSAGVEQANREDEQKKRAAAGQAPEGGRGGRPAETPTGGGRGAPPQPAAEKPSPTGPAAAAEAPEGQEAGPSQAPARAPGTAAASGIQTPSPTTVAGWPTGNVPPVMPSPAGGTRPQAAPPQFSPSGQPVQPIPQRAQNQPPPGTTWEYWGLKPPPGQEASPTARGVPYEESAGGPPARAPIAGRSPARPAAPPARPGRAAARGGGMARWQPMFQQVGQSMGVPPGLISAIVQLESGGNPDAVGTSGEHGLAQLMPATARALGVDPRDPQQAIRGAATLLRHLMTKYRGDIAKVLAAYNEGETQFDKRMRRGLPLPPITQRYVRNGLALLRAGGQQPGRAVAAGGGAD